MSDLRPCCRLLVIALLALQPVPLAPRPARAAERLPRAAEESWVEARSERFVVYSNGGHGMASRAARHLERVVDVLERTTSGLRTRGRLVRVFVFRDLDSFGPYQPLGRHETSLAAGFQVASEDLNQVAAVGDDPYYLRRFLAHECMHVVLSWNLGTVPLWFNEGFAELYGSLDARGREATLGAPISEHMRALRGRGRKFEWLLRVTPESAVYQGGAARETFYAASWALVHMLYFDREKADRFDRFLNRIRRGATDEQALRDAYGPGARDSLLNLLDEFGYRTGLYSATWEFEAPFESLPVQQRELESAEALALLGELVTALGPTHFDLARRHLEAAWRADSTNAMPAALLATIATMLDDGPAATRWSAALERSPSAAPRAHAVLGGLLARKDVGMEPLSWPGAGPSPVALRGRELLRRMLDARPESVEWLVPYALTFLEESGDVSEGIGSLLLARDASRPDADIEGALSALYVRAGQLRLARKLHEEIPPGPRQAFWRAWTGSLLARATISVVEDLLREDRFAEADSAVAGLFRATRERAVRDACDNMRRQIDERRGARAKVDESPDGARR